MPTDWPLITILENAFRILLFRPSFKSVLKKDICETIGKLRKLTILVIMININYFKYNNDMLKIRVYFEVFMDE